MLETVFLKLHIKLAPAWALVRVNFDSIHKSRRWALFCETTVCAKILQDQICSYKRALVICIVLQLNEMLQSDWSIAGSINHLYYLY